jgi:hypothetical protein
VGSQHGVINDTQPFSVLVFDKATYIPSNPAINYFIKPSKIVDAFRNGKPLPYAEKHKRKYQNN